MKKNLLSLFFIKGVNESLFIFNNTFRSYLKNIKKRPHICGAG